MVIHQGKLPPRQHATLLARIMRLDLGASAIEFALIIPFLLVLAGGLVEMTNLFFVRSQLNEVVRDATRRLAVDAFSQEEAREFITDKLARTTDAKGEIDITETSEKGEDATDITVSLDIPLKDILLFDFVAGSFGGSDKESPKLSVAVTMFKH